MSSSVAIVDRQHTSAPTTTNVEVRAAPTAVAGVPVENVIAMTEAEATWRSAESGDHAMVCMGITGGALNAAASTRDADANVFINCPLLADDAASYSTSCCHNVNSVVNNDTRNLLELYEVGREVVYETPGSRSPTPHGSMRPHFPDATISTDAAALSVSHQSEVVSGYANRRAVQKQ